MGTALRIHHSNFSQVVQEKGRKVGVGLLKLGHECYRSVNKINNALSTPINLSHLFVFFVSAGIYRLGALACCESFEVQQVYAEHLMSLFIITTLVSNILIYAFPKKYWGYAFGIGSVVSLSYTFTNDLFRYPGITESQFQQLYDQYALEMPNTSEIPREWYETWNLPVYHRISQLTGLDITELKKLDAKASPFLEISGFLPAMMLLTFIVGISVKVIANDANNPVKWIAGELIEAFKATKEELYEGLGRGNAQEAKKALKHKISQWIREWLGMGLIDKDEYASRYGTFMTAIPRLVLMMLIQEMPLEQVHRIIPPTQLINRLRAGYSIPHLKMQLEQYSNSIPRIQLYIALEQNRRPHLTDPEMEIFKEICQISHFFSPTVLNLLDLIE